MNAGRRICCNAANAYRPRYALRSIFFEPIGRRFASDLSPDTEPQSKAGAKPFIPGKRKHPKGRNSARKNTKTAAKLVESKKTLDEHIADAFEEDASLHDVQEQGGSKNTTPFQSAKLAAIAERKLDNANVEVLEYEGQFVQPTDRSPVHSMNLPWLGTMERDTGSSHMER